MVKPKRRPSKAVPENNSSTEWNEDESWVIVKKQKVTILVPPLPSAKRSAMPNLEPSQLQAMPTKPIDKQSQHSNEAQSKKASVAEQENSTPLAPKRSFQIAKRTPPQYIATIARPPIIDTMMEPENVGRAYVTKPHNIVEVLDTSKVIRRPRSLHGTTGSLDRSMLLNQRLRALNLERKLQKAGGLSRWLASLGLGQFIQLFKGKSFNKFQLVNLTMQKLKDMGADAVGPRRKLMHAIECVCQPYWFKAL